MHDKGRGQFPLHGKGGADMSDTIDMSDRIDATCPKCGLREWHVPGSCTWVCNAGGCEHRGPREEFLGWSGSKAKKEIEATCPKCGLRRKHELRPSKWICTAVNCRHRAPRGEFLDWPGSTAKKVEPESRIRYCPGCGKGFKTRAWLAAGIWVCRGPATQIDSTVPFCNKNFPVADWLAQTEPPVQEQMTFKSCGTEPNPFATIWSPTEPAPERDCRRCKYLLPPNPELAEYDPHKSVMSCEHYIKSCNWCTFMPCRHFKPAPATIPPPKQYAKHLVITHTPVPMAKLQLKGEPVMKLKRRFTRMFQGTVLILATIQAVQSGIWAWPGLRLLGRMMYPPALLLSHAICRKCGMALVDTPRGVVLTLGLTALVMVFVSVVLVLAFWLAFHKLYGATAEEVK